MSLDSFVKRSRPLPKALCTSRSIRDRESTFQATLFRVTSPTEAIATTKHVKNVLHADQPADHEMMAYRVMALKSGHTGLNGPDDFEVRVGSDDNHEKHGSEHILKIMNREGLLDVVVVVSRWFGGTLLGPVRFTHIENCTLDVCTQFKVIEELEGHVEQLQDLDKRLLDLRQRLATLGGQESTTTSSQNYNALLATLDLPKARRLVKARESAIKSVQTLIDKKASSQSGDSSV